MLDGEMEVSLLGAAMIRMNEIISHPVKFRLAKLGEGWIL